MTGALDIITGFVAFLLTIMVLSYLIGDNPLFRISIYVFVGVAAGYAGAVAWHQVIWPRLFLPLISGSLGERLLAIIPLFLGALLLAKISPRTTRLGNPAMAYLVGVGAAVAIGGGIFGTIFPQTSATIALFAVSQNGVAERLFEGSIILIGVVTTLAYFHFSGKGFQGNLPGNQIIRALRWVGQLFIAITFGALFAGIYAAAMTALVERLTFLWSFLTSIF